MSDSDHVKHLFEAMDLDKEFPSLWWILTNELGHGSRVSKLKRVRTAMDSVGGRDELTYLDAVVARGWKSGEDTPQFHSALKALNAAARAPHKS